MPLHWRWAAANPAILTRNHSSGGTKARKKRTLTHAQCAQHTRSHARVDSTEEGAKRGCSLSRNANFHLSKDNCLQMSCLFKLTFVHVSSSPLHLRCTYLCRARFPTNFHSHEYSSFIFQSLNVASKLTTQWAIKLGSNQTLWAAKLTFRGEVLLTNGTVDQTAKYFLKAAKNIIGLRWVA